VQGGGGGGGSSSYQLEYMEAGDGGVAKGWRVACPGTESLGVRVMNLSPGRSYMFRVSAGRAGAGGGPRVFSAATQPISTLHADWYRNRFGGLAELVKKGGERAPLDVLGGKMVLLYFSAHWCPPCRQFTPYLAEFYRAMKAAGRPFEVVFVSLDRDPSQFDEYLEEMPWYAIPYANAEVRQQMAQRYGVRGIPHLKVLSAETGNIVVDNAVGQLTPEVFAQWEAKAFARKRQVEAQIQAKKRAARIAQEEARAAESGAKGAKDQPEGRGEDRKADDAPKGKGKTKWVCEGDSCKMVDA